MNVTNHPSIVVIGGGQAGLSVSYHLQRRGLEHVVLDARPSAGQTWRSRWDSLRLFTPRRLDQLDGLALRHAGSPPTKDEFADYLDSYEQHFGLPVRHGVRVDGLSTASGTYRLTTSDGPMAADIVVVAMSSLQVPKVPAVANDLGPTTTSIHSAHYRNPDQLRDGGTLVVGVGNTGAEISVEVARTGRPTWLAGRESFSLPFRIDGWFGRQIASRLVAFMFLHVLTTRTPVGRRARHRMLGQADGLMRERPREMRRSGVRRVPRITDVREGRPVCADGTVLDVANVIWCTGYRSGLADWLHLPVLDEHELPVTDRGVVPDQPGLYFVGQNFQFAKASETVPGVGRDARYVVGAITRSLAHRRLPTPATPGGTEGTSSAA